MSYEKTTWAKGDVVTSAKLNKIEGGVAKATSDLPFVIAVVTGVEQVDNYTELAYLNIKPSDVLNDSYEPIAVPVFFDGNLGDNRMYYATPPYYDDVENVFMLPIVGMDNSPTAPSFNDYFRFEEGGK